MAESPGIERNQFLFQFSPFVGWILEEAHASIPTKDGIIIAGRADSLGLCERLQSLVEKRYQCIRRLPGIELCFRATLSRIPV